MGMAYAGLRSLGKYAAVPHRRAVLLAAGMLLAVALAAAVRGGPAPWVNAVILLPALAWLLRSANTVRALLRDLAPPLLLGVVLCLLQPGTTLATSLATTGVLCLLWFSLREVARVLAPPLPAAGQRWLRGSRLGEATAVIRQAGAKEDAAHLGEVPVPVALEPFHFLITGATGSGKSLCFIQLLQAARARGQRAVLADAGGEFLARFAAPGDVILNPFDARARAWSPFAEIAGAWDCDRLARALVPDAGGSDGQWQGYAQSLASAVLLRLWQRGCGTNARLLHWLTTAPVDELAELLAGLPAHSLTEPGASRMLGVVRGILGRHFAPFAALDPTGGAGAFSIRAFLAQESPHWLFLTFRDDQLSALRPLVACWLDLAISGLLSLAPDPQRRVWFALDELASLGRVQGLPDLLTKARKQGGCAIAGLQSVAQVEQLYGREGAQTLLSCLSTCVALRAPDALTAEYLSRYLGEAEVLESSLTHSSRGEISTREQRVRSRIVLPGELQALADRHGFLRLAGDFPSCPVLVPIPAVNASRVPAFVDTRS